MTQDEVLALMQSASSWADWDTKVAQVVADYNGRLPGFWMNILSGVDQQKFHEWGRKEMIVNRERPNVFKKPIT
jgi:hypothetical protein